MSWFPTMDLRWIERIGNGPGYRVKVLQHRWEQRWGQDIGGEEWRDIPIVGKLPESEGQSSEAITSTETSGLPARQSGSPGVDPPGERQKYLRCELVFKGKDCGYTGPVQTCDKTYASCRTMFNLTNFRGRPISLLPEERGLPRVTIHIPMPPVKKPNE